MTRRGWFVIEGVQDGDRTLEQQIKGLDHIDFGGKRVLETGCAEGCMSRWMIERGAASVHGVDVVKDHIREAWRQCWGLPCSFEVHDLNEPRTWSQFDIVLALATLHKVRRPDVLARSLARCCKEMVIRLPMKNDPWIIVDQRSGGRPHDIHAAMEAEGFYPARVSHGSFSEWCCHYARSA